MTWANILITACMVEALAMYLFDRGMKKNLADGVTLDHVRWAPLYWESPELFTDLGNAYRRAAQATMIFLILTFLALGIVAPIG